LFEGMVPPVHQTAITEQINRVKKATEPKPREKKKDGVKKRKHKKKTGKKRASNFDTSQGENCEQGTQERDEEPLVQGV